MKNKYLAALGLFILSVSTIWAQRQREFKKDDAQRNENRISRETVRPEPNRTQNTPSTQPQKPSKSFDNRRDNFQEKESLSPINNQPRNRRNNEPAISKNRDNERIERINRDAAETRHNNGTEIFKDRRVARPIVRTTPSARPFVPVNRNINYNYREVGYRPDYRRPYSFIGIRYTNFYGSRRYIPYLNSRYYYYGGFFYSPFDTYYQVVFAPVGIRVWGLPWGYRRFYIGPTLYYYYGGTYYRNYNASYEVVEAPLGSILPELPQGAQTTVINDHKYYVLNGTYYAETLRGDETWYTVVGKNGVLNQETVTLREEANPIAEGDVLTELPEDYTVEVINNEKYYVSKGVYYKEFITDNNIGYKVVPKPKQ